MADGNDITVKVDEHWLGTLISNIVEIVLSIFRPVFHFVTEVAGAGWLGFAIVFMIFFMVYLIRMGARSGNTNVYADALRYIGQRGMACAGIYMAVLLVEFLFMPPAAVFFYLLFNSISGGEPGLSAFLGFLSGNSPYKAQFITDMVTFYGSDRLLLPLGLRQTGLILVAFGSMALVAKAIRQAGGLLTHRQSTE